MTTLLVPSRSKPSQRTGGRRLNMLVLLTRACLLECGYCHMDRRQESMSPRTMRRAIDLLLREKDPLELQYFGGEPLLEYALLLSGIEYASRRARRLGRDLRQVVTTNGLLLTPARSRRLVSMGCSFILSLDGGPGVSAAQRPLAKRGGEYPWEALRRNLRALERSGADFFVNLVVSPASAGKLASSTAFLLDEGVRRLQFSYALGADWTVADRKTLARQLALACRRAEAILPPVDILNLNSSAEPVLLSRQHVVDVDGRLYLGCSIVLEKRWPRLHEAFRCGQVGRLARLPCLDRAPAGQLDRILAAGLERAALRSVLQDIDMGYAMKRFWEGRKA